ncbi:MAG TPA: aminodeoxychorismate lyase [Fontimonas sp.]
MSPRTLRDGVAVDAGLAGSRALHYGDGVFRTVLHAGGRLVDWDRHMVKLAADCAALQLAMPNEAQLLDEARQIVAGSPDAIVKIIVSRAAAARGYRPPGTASERWLIASAAPDLNRAAQRDGICIDWSSVTLAAQPLLAGVKHLNRLEQVLASRDWPAGIDERLLCDASGQVICGTRSNLFCLTDGRLLTPALNQCGIAGIMRGKLIELAQTLGLDVGIQPLTPAALHAADEVFVCNAVIGIWPVRALGTRQWAAPGVQTARLMQALAHPSTQD